jgi:TonB-linked SusC/RagA family outer membrane protein
MTFFNLKTFKVMKKTKPRGNELNHPLKKILLTMRIVFALLVLGILQAHATDAYSQKTRLSLNVTDAQLVTVLDKIEDETEFFFLYNEKLLDTERKVSIMADNQLIDAVLDKLFAGTDITHTIIDRKIILAPDYLANNPAVQLQKVTGKVSGTKGEPLPGVTVTVKGKYQGTATGPDGMFSLDNVESSDILIFSFIGMKSQELPVGTTTYFEVTLSEELIGMDAVVVTALGIKREEKALGYAVQKVNGETVSTVKGVDIGTSLTGKVSGLLVRNSTEFAAEPEIFIRGEKPLLVIDGVTYGNMSLREIPSDDIEDINILKGSTASALYGYRGANGAIMVTTKRGAAKNGLSVTVNSSTLFTAGYLAIPEMQSTYGRVVNTSTNTYARSGDGSWGVPLDGRDVIQWDPVSKSLQLMPYLPVGKDNFRNFLEQGFVLNNNINIVQQSDLGSIRASATSVQNKGQYPNSMFNKLTYSLGGEMKIKNFSLSSGITYNKQLSPNIGFSGYTGYDPMYNMLVWAAPDYDIRDYEDYWLIPDEVQNSSYTSTNNNPYFDRYERLHSVNKDVFNVSLDMSYDILSWLKATLRSGYDVYSDRQEVRISKGSFQGGGSSTVIPNGTQIWGESQRGSYNMGLSRGFSINNDFLVTADKTFNDFTVNALAGATMYYRQDDGMEARTQAGLSIPGFYSLKASINPAVVGTSVQRQQVNSIYGRLAVSWKSLIFAEATLRNDWSSTLPLSTRSYLYPSFSGSFIASNLLPEIDWLSLWKIRSSWTSSKNPAGIYDINSVYSIVSNAWSTLSSASLPTTIRGTDVLPESASTFEIGTVVNLFRNRASVDLSYYSKRMYDLLDYAYITPASGFSRRFINKDEEITRKGVEISANVTPVKDENWQWDMSVNWSAYARYYTKIDSVYSPDKPWVYVGARYDAYILRDYLKDPDGNIIHNNGLPLYSSYDSKFGNYDPDWIWGLSNTIRYKNLSLTITADGRVGGIAQTTTEMYMWRAGSHPNSVVPERYLDATQSGTNNYIGDGVKVVGGTVTYDTYGNITSDTREYAPNDIAVTYKRYIEAFHKGTAWGGSPSPVDTYSTTFFKIREVAITYRLPASLCGKLKMSNASVSAIGQNLFLWAKDFKYSDPDGGSENFSDPSVRYLGLNLKIGF